MIRTCGERRLGGLELGQLVLEVAHRIPRVGQLAGLGVADPRHGGSLALEAGARAREAVALGEHLGGEGLLTDLELSQPGRLGRDRPTGRADLANDVDVLLAHALHEFEALEQIAEPGRAQHDGDDIGVVGFVAGHELLGEHALGMGFVGLEPGQAKTGGGQLGAEPGQLGALGVQVGLDAAEAAGERGDARVELSDPTRRGPNGPGQRGDVPLARADLLTQLTDAGGPRRGRGQLVVTAPTAHRTTATSTARAT